MASKKGSKKKRRNSSSPLSREEKCIVDTLQKEFVNMDPAEFIAKIPDSRVAKAFVEEMPVNDKVIPFLSIIDKTFTEKGVKKAVKRARFKLRNNGFEVDGLFGEEIAAAPVALKGLSTEKSVAFIGPVDSTGS
jgi:hypothetical protein